MEIGLLPLGPWSARQLLLQQEDIDAGIGEHGLDALDVRLLARERRESRIERVADGRADGEQRFQATPCGGGKWGETQAMGSRGVEQQPPQPAGERDRPEAPAARQRRMDEVLDGFDHIIERRDADGPYRPRDGIEGGE